MGSGGVQAFTVLISLHVREVLERSGYLQLREPSERQGDLALGPLSFDPPSHFPRHAHAQSLVCFITAGFSGFPGASRGRVHPISDGMVRLVSGSARWNTNGRA